MKHATTVGLATLLLLLVRLAPGKIFLRTGIFACL